MTKYSFLSAIAACGFLLTSCGTSSNVLQNVGQALAGGMNQNGNTVVENNQQQGFDTESLLGNLLGNLLGSGTTLTEKVCWAPGTTQVPTVCSKAKTCWHKPVVQWLRKSSKNSSIRIWQKSVWSKALARLPSTKIKPIQPLSADAPLRVIIRSTWKIKPWRWLTWPDWAAWRLRWWWRTVNSVCCLKATNCWASWKSGSHRQQHDVESHERIAEQLRRHVHRHSARKISVQQISRIFHMAAGIIPPRSERLFLPPFTVQFHQSVCAKC